jgi:hypothetical protein
VDSQLLQKMVKNVFLMASVAGVSAATICWIVGMPFSFLSVFVFAFICSGAFAPDADLK